MDGPPWDVLGYIFPSGQETTSPIKAQRYSAVELEGNGGHDQTNKETGTPSNILGASSLTPEEGATPRLSGDNGLHLER